MDRFFHWGGLVQLQTGVLGWLFVGLVLLSAAAPLGTLWLRGIDRKKAVWMGAVTGVFLWSCALFLLVALITDERQAAVAAAMAHHGYGWETALHNVVMPSLIFFGALILAAGWAVQFVSLGFQAGRSAAPTLGCASVVFFVLFTAARYGHMLMAAHVFDYDAAMARRAGHYGLVMWLALITLVLIAWEVGRRHGRARPQAINSVLSMGLLLAGFAAFASTRGMAADAQMPFAFRYVLPGRPGIQLPETQTCNADATSYELRLDDGAPKFNGYVVDDERLSGLLDTIRRNCTTLHPGAPPAAFEESVVVVANADARTAELTRSLEIVLEAGWSIAIATKRAREVHTATLGALPTVDYCAVQAPGRLPSADETVQQWVDRAVENQH